MKDGAALLNAVAEFYRRFVRISDAQAVGTSLWTFHTHAIAAATTTPYLSVTSPEKQSGKTRLLEVAELLVAKPWLTGRVTAACLVRKIDAQHPTLLLDESDAAFNGDKEYAEALRGVLNTGHRRGGQASCCVGQGANISFKDFATFCPKAIAGIGKLPDTVGDRSIPIRLKRKSPGETVSRFRRREAEPEAKVLRSKITAWIAGELDHLRDARPALPDAISDRQQDGAEPLLAIADAAGGEWPAKARSALVELFGSTAASDDSAGVRLLADIRLIFADVGVDKITSADLIAKLVEIETSPWSEWSHGKPLSPVGLGRLLKPFEVIPRTIRAEARVAKGYARESFEDAWSRYLPARALEPDSDPLQPLQANVYAPETHIFDPLQNESVTGQKSEESPMFTRVVTDVTDQNPDQASRRNSDYLLEAAISHCREAGVVSISKIMATLFVSRAEAVRFIDEMERLGLVGPAAGAGPRPFRSAVN